MYLSDLIDVHIMKCEKYRKVLKNQIIVHVVKESNCKSMDEFKYIHREFETKLDVKVVGKLDKYIESIR